jgi:phosphate transport system permease protein
MAAAPIAALSPRKERFAGSLRGADGVALMITLLFGLAIVAVTVLLVIQLWTNSAPSRARLGFGFLISRLWNPVTDEYGALPFIYGTVLTSTLALLISAPLGIGAAIYLAELAQPKLSNALTFLIELLAAVPSVIFGLIAIFTLVPLMRSAVGPGLKAALGWTPLFSGPVFGVGYLTAGLILAIMTFPFIISVSREALMMVPREQREAALALGATKWESTWQIVVPFARLGIFGSIFLALARALGETMAVTMVIGNSPTIKASLLSSGYTIAAVIANEFTEATGKVYLSALVELGLVLFVLTMVINALARLLIFVTGGKASAKG